ncbi:MAG: hypothetical protein J5860_00375, partial [Clostridia bacterium]|nr:hypothetical protein [Clostridia bacterium]
GCMFALLSVLRLDEQIPFGDMSACCGLPQLQRHRSRRTATCRSVLFRTFSFALKEKVHKGVLALSREKFAANAVARGKKPRKNKNKYKNTFFIDFFARV